VPLLFFEMLLMLRSLLCRSLLLSSLAVLVLVSAGCGPGKGTPTSGKVVLPKGLSFEKDDSVEIGFVPDDPKVKRGATATVAATGGSEVAFSNMNSAETTGVLPGKYKVTVKVTPYMGGPGSQGRKQKFDDAVNKKYEVSTTKLTYEVAAGADQKVNIDLQAGTITKE